MSERNNEALKIADEIIKNIEENPYSLSNVRKFYHLVKILKMNDEIEWAENELYGYENIEDCPVYREVTNVRNEVTYLEESYGILRDWWEKGDTFLYSPSSENPSSEKIEIELGVSNFYHILTMADNEIYRKTSEILSKLKFDKMESDIFEETRKTVDRELSSLCPEAFKKLTETYEDLIENKSKLDLQQIALGCRLVIKDFADAIYPPKEGEVIIGSDGKPHDVGNEKYINRIATFIRDRTSSKSNKDFMKSHLEYVESFLKNVYNLASNGAHNEISKEQASRCLIYTYLILGDIINLCSLSSKEDQ